MSFRIRRKISVEHVKESNFQWSLERRFFNFSRIFASRAKIFRCNHVPVFISVSVSTEEMIYDRIKNQSIRDCKIGLSGQEKRLWPFFSTLVRKIKWKDLIHPWRPIQLSRKTLEDYDFKRSLFDFGEHLPLLSMRRLILSLFPNSHRRWLHKYILMEISWKKNLFGTGIRTHVTTSFCLLAWALLSFRGFASSNRPLRPYWLGVHGDHAEFTQTANRALQFPQILSRKVVQYDRQIRLRSSGRVGDPIETKGLNWACTELWDSPTICQWRSASPYRNTVRETSNWGPRAALCTRPAVSATH